MITSPIMSEARPPARPPEGAPLLREGRSWPELALALRDLKRDDLDWRRGRHAAFVWHADDAVEQVAREAYALFMTENGLGLRVFPSLRRMEADVVAMVRHLLGGDAAVTGHLTSGGTESIFLATHAARQWARQQRPDVTEPEIVAPWSAHPAVSKAAHLPRHEGPARAGRGRLPGRRGGDGRRHHHAHRHALRIGAHLLARRHRSHHELAD